MRSERGRLHRFLPDASLAGNREAAALLGISRVGLQASAEFGQGFPTQHILAPLLDGRPVEAWFGRQTCRAGKANGVSFRSDGELLFGVIELAEAAFNGDGAVTPLQQAAQQAYMSLFRVLAEERFPHLWRVWNYLGDINCETAGLERYRQFNIGRHRAFEAAGRLDMGSIPAASALGVTGGPLSIAFLAGRRPAQPVENPRQMSAYRYPSEYGPRSPIFSRAALCRLAGEEWLFVSGTASIVGHHSIHLGDPLAQTREIVVNLEALLAEASRKTDGPAYRLDELSARVYVRHSGDYPVVRAELASALGAAAPVVYMQADVCRADLLVEVEAQACHVLP